MLCLDHLSLKNDMTPGKQEPCVPPKSTKLHVVRADPGAPTTPATAQASLGELDDGALISRIARRDRLAFAEILKRYLGMCVAVGRRTLGNDADAEDVAQETMLKLWQTSKKLEVGATGVGPWLARVTYNSAIDRIRRQRPTDNLDDAPEIPDAPRQHAALENQERTRRLESVLEALPERQRLALTLFHYQGFSQLEVADILKVSIDAVDSLLRRARQTLRRELEDEWRSLLNTDPAS